jgi:hypothetical protein
MGYTTQTVCANIICKHYVQTCGKLYYEIYIMSIDANVSKPYMLQLRERSPCNSNNDKFYLDVAETNPLSMICI